MTRARRVRARTLLAAVLITTTVGAAGAGDVAPARADTGPPGLPPPPGVPELPHPDSHGLELVGAAPVEPDAGPGTSRLIDLTVATDELYEPRGPDGPDIDQPATVRVLLPPHYDPDRRRPYPVLYLLHGGGGGYWQWTMPRPPVHLPGLDAKEVLDTAMDPDPTDATPGTPFPGIVVMPEGGWIGWYTNWAGGTQGGFAPDWEDFHVGQLVPWVDANFNTNGRRSGRAIAGVSMGGLGALMYATRHPLTFSAVGSFSGPADVRLPLLHQTVSENASGFPGAGASFGFVGLENEDLWITDPPPGDVEGRFRVVFGQPGPRGDWPQRNPMVRPLTFHAFAGKLALYSGQETTTPTDVTEREIGRTNQAFHHVLDSWWVDHRYCAGPGPHSWDYFERDLVDFVNFVYGTPWEQCTTNPGWEQDWEPEPEP